MGIDFDESRLKKRSFFFPDGSRPRMEDTEIGSETSVTVSDERGDTVHIPFRVTRNTLLSPKIRWVYGEVLGMPEGEYHQIELKLHAGKPERDTVEVFLQAPPLVL